MGHSLLTSEICLYKDKLKILVINKQTFLSHTWTKQVFLTVLCVCVLSFDWLSMIPRDYSPPGSSVHGILQATGIGCHFLLQGIFPTQGSNLSLLYLLNRQVDSLPLSHMKSRHLFLVSGFSWLSDKYLSAMLEIWVQSWVRKIPWKRKWQPTPVFLPRKSHGQRSLEGYSSWSHKGVWHD